jgi:hypothetical protein
MNSQFYKLKTGRKKSCIILLHPLLIIFLVSWFLFACEGKRYEKQIATAEDLCLQILLEFSTYGADSPYNVFPHEINNWNELISAFNVYSSVSEKLKEQQVLEFVSYRAYDFGNDFLLILTVNNVPDGVIGKKIMITADGIIKKSGI